MFRTSRLPNGRPVIAMPLLLAMAVLGGVNLSAAADTSAQQIEFFERQVRPILSEHCYSCHGEKKQESDLRLDSAAAVRVGGASGPVIVPGDPAASPLITAINYLAEPQMPPAGKLPDETIATLTEWVKVGAPFPESPAPSADGAPASHWAFQPIVEPPIPQTGGEWPRTAVDQFVLAKLAFHGVAPSPIADRRTILRRLSYSLVGLPPSAEEVDAFVADPSPDAYGAAVERLLASPRYGERWARHWLDVARYADSKGYIFTEERNFPYSYTYRDWVIRAFNEDLPYDQFLIQQIAADQLTLNDDKRPLAAMGFLTLGRRFLGNMHDIIDDRIDVVCRGTMALTVGCARCHNHKYDPIPTADYYSLYGVFASSVEKELPIAPGSEEYQRELHAREQELQEFQANKHAETLHYLRMHTAEYFLAARKTMDQPDLRDFMFVDNRGELNHFVLGRWRNYFLRTREKFHPVFGPWNILASLTDDQFPAQAPALMTQFATGEHASGRINRRVASIFAEPQPTSIEEVAKRYELLLANVEESWQSAIQAATGAAAPTALPNSDDEELRQTLYDDGSPTNLNRRADDDLFDKPSIDMLVALRKKVHAWRTQSPAPPSAMAMVDASEPMTPKVFLRGNPSNPGPTVPRQFLAVASRSQRQPFERGSGRLELAQAIVHRDNPLTARVIVNRVWAHHFGRGLVLTPSDFGTRSEPPSHPELLDWLASRFMSEGWSIKWLQRQIVLSAAFQQSSADRPETRSLDPDNRWLCRFPRQRLDFESQRDSILAAAGTLDTTMEGPGVDITTAPYSTRRSIYARIDRQNLPGLFRAFDFASPDTHAPQRFTTNVPQQALFWMNHPFVAEQATALAARVEPSSPTSDEAGIVALYRYALGRAPRADELPLALEFIRAQGAIPPVEGQPTAWQLLAQSLLESNEFVFID